MIQRIQSVYLFIGALLLALVVVFSDMWMEPVAALHPWLPWMVYGLAAVGGLIGFAVVLLYKDRKKQARIIAVVQWLTLGLALVLVVVLAMLSFRSEQTEFSTSAMTYVVLLMPAAAYTLFSLARRAVKNDIELVRSMDRLR